MAKWGRSWLNYPGQVPAITRALHPALAPYVVSCVGFDYHLPVDAVHHGLPSTALTVVLSFDEPLDCGWLGESGSERYWTLVGGLHERPALIRTHGRQHGIQLALTPAGSRALLGLPAGEVGNTLIRPEDSPQLRTLLSESLRGRLAEVGWHERFVVLEERLLQRVSRADRSAVIAPEIGEAWRLTVSTHGRLPVEEVAHRVGWSRRHLQARWAAEFGLGPKRLARVARFGRAQQLQDAGVPLVEVAHRAGYADQSHLNRDWRALAGQTPVESANDFPIVLENLDGVGASSGA